MLPGGAHPRRTAAHPAGVQEGRDGKGRFAPGNKAGRGNPFSRKLAAARAAFAGAISEKDLAERARSLLKRALDGDTAAAKVLLAYVLGVPQPVANPDRQDQEEWAALLQCPHLATAQEGLGRIAPDDAVRMADNLTGRLHVVGVKANGDNPVP